MRALGNRSVVLQLVVILRVEGAPQLRSAFVESSQHLDLRFLARGDPLLRAAEILEARLVDARSEYRRVRHLHRLVGVLVIVSARCQVEATNPGPVDIGVREGIAKYQSVRVIQLIIDPRTHPREALRHLEDAEKRLDSQCLGIQRHRVGDGAVVNRVPLRIQIEGCALVDGSTGIALQLVQQ